MRFFSNTDLFTTNTDIPNYFSLACCLFLLTIIFSSCGDYLRSCPDECLPENLDNSWGLPADCNEPCRRRVEGTDTLRFNEAGSVTTYQPHGRKRARLGAVGDGGAIAVFNTTGNPIIDLRLDKYGNGVVGADSRKITGRTLKPGQ